MRNLLNNKLIRKIHRHSTLATLFRTVDSTRPPSFLQQSSAPSPVPFDELYSVQATHPLVSLPHSVSRSESSSIAEISPTISARTSPTGLNPLEAPISAQPPIENKPITQRSSPEPLAGKTIDRDWKRLQAILHKHEQTESSEEQFTPSPGLSTNQAKTNSNVSHPADTVNSTISSAIPSGEYKIELSGGPVGSMNPASPSILSGQTSPAGKSTVAENLLRQPGYPAGENKPPVHTPFLTPQSVPSQTESVQNAPRSAESISPDSTPVDTHTGRLVENQPGEFHPSLPTPSIIRSVDSLTEKQIADSLGEITDPKSAASQKSVSDLPALETPKSAEIVQAKPAAHQEKDVNHQRPVASPTSELLKEQKNRDYPVFANSSVDLNLPVDPQNPTIAGGVKPPAGNDLWIEKPGAASSRPLETGGSDQAIEALPVRLSGEETQVTQSETRGLPLEAVWPVTAIARENRQEITPVGSGMQKSHDSQPESNELKPDETPANVNPHKPDEMPLDSDPGGREDSIRHLVSAIEPGRPSDSDIDVITPRRPRPSISPQHRAGVVIQTKGVEPINAPDKPEGHTPTSQFSPSPASLQTDGNPQASNPPDERIHRLKDVLTEEGFPKNEVQTEIGPLPADLWQLLGQPAPKNQQMPVKSFVNPPQESNPPDYEDRTPVMPAPFTIDRPSQPGIIQRQEQESRAAPEPTPTSSNQPVPADQDTTELSKRVYSEIKRRLAIEWERLRRK